MRSADGVHGIEIKTLMDNKNDKITMHPKSRRRKEEWLKKEKACGLHTVVLDDRDTFEDGKNKEQYSGHRIYYAKGVGAFRIKGMQTVASFDELRKVILAG